MNEITRQSSNYNRSKSRNCCRNLPYVKQEWSKGYHRRCDEEAGKQAIEQLVNEVIDWLFVNTDVSNEEDVKNLISTASEHFGGVDLLVNNAAVNIRKSNIETSLEEWNKVTGVNLTGAFLCSKYAIPEMEKRGGEPLSISLPGMGRKRLKD